MVDVGNDGHVTDIGNLVHQTTDFVNCEILIKKYSCVRIMTMLHNGSTYNYNNSIRKKREREEAKKERVSHPSIVLFIHPKGVHYQHTHFELLRVVCVFGGGLNKQVGRVILLFES